MPKRLRVTRLQALTMTAASGGYSWAGFNANFFKARNLTITTNSGIFQWAGFSSTLSKQKFYLGATSGSFSMTGRPVTFTYTTVNTLGWTNNIFPMSIQAGAFFDLSSHISGNQAQISNITSNVGLPTGVSITNSPAWRVNASAGATLGVTNNVNLTIVPTSEADFQARATAPGVFRVRNWTTSADLGGGFGAEFGNLTQGANPAPVIDTVNKPFGNGSLRFNVTPILGGSMWWTNMSPDLSLQFGSSGETVYFQFPYMVSAEIPPTYAAKIFLFGTGDTTGVFQSSCSDLEIELNSQIFGQKFLAAYNACPGSCGANSVFTFFPGAGNPGGQKFLVANQWMTIQCGVTLGPRETHNGSSWFAGSNVKIWIQYDIGPEILLYDWTGGVTAGSTPTSSPPNWGLCAGHTAPSTQRYGKLWLLPYNQELTGTNQQPGSIWYGPVIFSTQKIAARLA